MDTTYYPITPHPNLPNRLQPTFQPLTLGLNASLWRTPNSFPLKDVWSNIFLTLIVCEISIPGKRKDVRTVEWLVWHWILLNPTKLPEIIFKGHAVHTLQSETKCLTMKGYWNCRTLFYHHKMTLRHFQYDIKPDWPWIWIIRIVCRHNQFYFHLFKWPQKRCP